MLAFLVIDIEEENILKQLISQNYFYFDFKEKEKIMANCYDILADNFPNDFDKKFNILYNNFYSFISNNKVLILNGFINFRLKEYFNILDNLLNQAVNQFIIEKEYTEFISLLRLYTSSQPYGCNIVHLIYSSTESILLDENKNMIISPNDIFKAKYLSDISFSSNDYALNTLLNLLPEKIYIHLPECSVDEFIHTIQLIFENRVHLCTDCEICKMKHFSMSNYKK